MLVKITSKSFYFIQTRTMYKEWHDAYCKLEIPEV